MRFARMYAAVVLSFLPSFALPLTAQQSSTQANNTAPALLQNSLAALTGGQSISDVTLTGTASWIVGADTDTGKTTLMAKGTGESRVDLNLASRTRTEIRNDIAGYPQGASALNGRALQAWALHNCWINASCFFPLLTILASASDPTVVLICMGQETRDGWSVQHIRSYRYINDKSACVTSLTQRLSTLDLYLDSASSLPVAITFNSHPDNDDGTNIATEIDFSNYHSVNGVQVPFHIQKQVFSALVLDITITAATFNSGPSDTLSRSGKGTLRDHLLLDKPFSRSVHDEPRP